MTTVMQRFGLLLKPAATYRTRMDVPNAVSISAPSFPDIFQKRGTPQVKKERKRHQCIFGPRLLSDKRLLRVLLQGGCSSQNGLGRLYRALQLPESVLSPTLRSQHYYQHGVECHHTLLLLAYRCSSSELVKEQDGGILVDSSHAFVYGPSPPPQTRHLHRRPLQCTVIQLSQHCSRWCHH